MMLKTQSTQIQFDAVRITGLIRGHVRSMHVNRSDADDLTQSAIVRLLRAFDFAKLDTSHQTALAFVAAKCVVHDYRRSKERQPVEVSLNRIEEPSTADHDWEMLEESAMRIAALAEARQRLPYNYQRVLTLIYDLGYSRRTAAAITGSTVNAIGGVLKRANSRLYRDLSVMAPLLFPAVVAKQSRRKTPRCREENVADPNNQPDPASSSLAPLLKQTTRDRQAKNTEVAQQAETAT